MNVPHYPLKASNDHLNFEFYSDGPKGRIKKVIKYTELAEVGVFNLGLGDMNETTGKIDDLAISNNRDRDKILYTVANSTLYFFHSYPSGRIIIVGRTPARMRLFRIQIAKHWNLITQIVLIQGVTNNEWETFQQNRRYDAILIAARKL